MTRFPFYIAIAFAIGACSSSRDRPTTDAGAGIDGGAGSDGGGADTGATDGWWSCTTNPQCVVLPESCCGSCGAATPTDMVGVNQSRVADNRAEACADPVACPECAAPDDPYLIATCATDTCQALDLRAEGVLSCGGDGDCLLATPRCCDCNVHTAQTAIAVSSSGTARLSELTCDPDAACPPCVPSFDGLEAFCDAGQCAVRALP